MLFAPVRISELANLILSARYQIRFLQSQEPLDQAGFRVQHQDQQLSYLDFVAPHFSTDCASSSFF